jgi:hypothetical protein
MGDYSVICGLSGLPITRKEKVKLIFLRSTSDTDEFDTYWLPRYQLWKPLMLPVDGIYNNHAWIEEIPDSPAVQLLLKYFSKPEIKVMDKQTGEPGGNFTFPEGDFDKMTDALFDKHPKYQSRFSETKQHSFCIVSEAAYNFAIQLAEKQFESRDELKELHEKGIQDYLCPIFPYFRTARREEGVKEYQNSSEWFEDGGESVNDSSYDDAYRENHAWSISQRSGNFLNLLHKAIEVCELPYIMHERTQDRSILEDTIDMILLKRIMSRYGIHKRFEPLRTYDIYDPEFDKIFVPWNEFVVSEAKRKREIYEPEVEDRE